MKEQTSKHGAANKAPLAAVATAVHYSFLFSCILTLIEAPNVFLFFFFFLLLSRPSAAFSLFCSTYDTTEVPALHLLLLQQTAVCRHVDLWYIYSVYDRDNAHSLCHTLLLYSSIRSTIYIYMVHIYVTDETYIREWGCLGSAAGGCRVGPMDMTNRRRIPLS